MIIKKIIKNENWGDSNRSDCYYAEIVTENKKNLMTLINESLINGDVKNNKVFLEVSKYAFDSLEEYDEAIEELEDEIKGAIEHYNSVAIASDCPEHYREFLSENEDVFKYQIDDIVSEISDSIAVNFDEKILSDDEIKSEWLDYIHTDVVERIDWLNDSGKDRSIYFDYLEKIEKMYSD